MFSWTVTVGRQQHLAVELVKNGIAIGKSVAPGRLDICLVVMLTCCCCPHLFVTKLNTIFIIAPNEPNFEY